MQRMTTRDIRPTVVASYPWLIAAAAMVTTLAPSTPAAAQDPSPRANAEPTAESASVDSPGHPLDHRGQVGLRAGVGVPYVFAIKYGEGPACEENADETFCRRFGAPTLDLELGYAISSKVELGALVRVGLDDDEAADASPIALGLGARAYISATAPLKVFFGGRAMLDLTSSDTPDWTDVDVGIRGEFGVQYDIVRWVGAYLQLGETIQVLRGLYFVTDLSGGLQVRLP